MNNITFFSRRWITRKLSRLTLLFAVALLALPSHAAYVQVYSTIQKGALTFTGNTLALNSLSTSGQGGAFIAANLSTQLTTPNYAAVLPAAPPGTTLAYASNASQAVLNIPVGATVLYAELIWSGTIGALALSAYDSAAVSLTIPSGSTYSITPSGVTKGTSGTYYTRSSNVTGLVQIGGAGTYTVGGVPAQIASAGSTDAAGWTLAVAYADASQPARNLTVFVGAEQAGAAPVSVSGFCTPVSGPVNGRVLVSGIEGDPAGTGDTMRFGPSSTLVAGNQLFGPNNPTGNFFASQINGDTGTLDTSGTFGTRNSPTGGNVTAARQGYDITNVDASSQLNNSQTTAFAQGTTTGDNYAINALAMQINVTSPVFPVSVKSVNKATTFVGDTLHYTINLDNTAGNGAANGVTFYDTIPAGMVLVSNSVTINGTPQPGANPATGVPIGNIPVGAVVSVGFDVNVVSLPASPALARFDNAAHWTYTYVACAGVVAQAGEVTTATVSTLAARLEPVKSVSPTGQLVGGQTATYTISIPNTGLLDTSGTTLADLIPAGTVYVVGSTKLNGIAVADGSGGVMPFVAAALVNSPGKAAGVIAIGASATVQFQVAATSGATVNNVATIDPDGAGPGTAMTASAVNSGLNGPGVAKAFSPTTIAAGGVSRLTVTLTNLNASVITGVKVTDNLPGGMTIANPANAATTCPGGSVSATPSGTTLALSGASIPSGGSCTFAADVTVATAGTYTNTIPAGAVSSTNAGVNTAGSQSLIVTPPPSVGKSFTPGTVAPNTSSTLTITLSNPTATAMTSVTFTDTLPTTAAGAPGNMTLFNTVTSNSCGGTLTDSAGAALAVGSGSIKLTGGTIPANNVCTITVNVKAPTGGTYGNTIPVGALSTSGGSNIGPAVGTLQIASPQVNKSFASSTVAANTATAMTITLTNVTGAIISSLAFTDTYPTGLVNSSTIVTNTGCGGTATASATATNPGTLSLSGGTLAAGASCTLSVNVQSASSGTYTNTIAAGAVSSSIGSNAAGTSATLNVARPNISKAFSAGTVPFNNTVTLTITLSNATAVAMTGAAFTDNLPSGLTASVPGGTCVGTKAASGSTVSITGGTIPANGSCTVTASITGTSIGLKTNTIASGDLTVTGPAAASNGTAAIASISVLAAPTITKSFLTSPILPNTGMSTVQIVLANSNSVALSGATFTDTFPTTPGAMTLFDLTTTNSCSGSLLSNLGAALAVGSAGIQLTGGTIPANGSCTITVNVKATTAGDYTNTIPASPTAGFLNTSNGGGNTIAASAPLSVRLAAPTLTKSFSPATIVANSATTMTLTLVNPSTAQAITGAALSDIFPAGMKVFSTPGFSNTCGGTVTSGNVANDASFGISAATVPFNAGGTGSCSISVQVTSTLTAAAPGMTNTTGTLTSTNANPGATASANLIVTAPPLTTPTIAKSFSPSSIGSGDISTITFNLGSANTGILNNANFSDTLVNMGVASTTIGGTCAGVTNSPALAVGATALNLTVPNLAPGGCSVTIQVTSTNLGNNPNSVSGVTTTQTPSAGAGAGPVNLTVMTSPTAAKTFTPSSIAIGGSTVLNVSISNANAAAITGAGFTDNYPVNLTHTASPAAAFTAASSTAGCSGAISAVANGTSLALSGANIPANTTCNITVNVKTLSTTATTHVNPSFTVTTTNAGSATVAAATLTVMAPPTVSKTFLTNPVAKDAVTVLSIAMTNPNGVAITGAAFSDNFPTLPDNKLVIANPGNPVFTPASVTAGCTGTITGANGAQTLALNGGTIPANATCSVTVNVKSSSNASPTYVNSSGPVTTSNAGTAAAASDSLTVLKGLAVSKAFSPATIVAGANSQLTITLNTTAAGSGSLGAAITDTYPSGLVNASGTPLVSNSCAGTITATAGAGSVSLSGGTIPANSSCTIVVNVTAAATGTYTNTLPAGALTATNPADSSTDPASADLTVTAAPIAPTVTKTFAAASMVDGGKTQLTLTLGNSNATAVTLTSPLVDTLPTSPGNMVIATPNNLGGTCSGVSAVVGSGTITVASGTSIPPGGCSVTVDITANTLGTYTNTIPAGGLATGAGSNAAAANASLIIPALPTISKSFAPTAIVPGGISTITFTLGNINSTVLTNANFTDSLSNMSVASTTIGGSCAGVTNSPALALGATALNLTIPSVPAGGCTITVQVTGTTLGTWPNTASGVTATELPVAGSASNTANLQVAILPPNYIFGTVFEDVNYGGGAGRSLASSSAVGVSGVRVELYNNLGTFVSATTTGIDGSYSFVGLVIGTYTVRVANATVASTRPGGCAAGTCMPVQTFRTDASSGGVVPVTDRVGGQVPGKIDAGNGSTSLISLTTATTAPQSVTSVALSIPGVTGVDFGYNFDTIVNKNLTGQGSFNQFIINSNALGGESSLAQAGFRMNNGVPQFLPAGKETSIFMAANGVTHPGLVSTFANQLTSGRLLLNYTTGGPGAISGVDTVVDGTTQTYNVGDTTAGVTGTGGSVGIDGLTLGVVQLPEVEIQGNSAQSFGIQFNAATNGSLRGTSVWKFGNAATTGNVVVSSASGVLLEQNIIGATASGFSDPGAARTAGNCVYASGGSTGLAIIHNLIGFCTLNGVTVAAAAGSLSNNEIRGSASADGIQVAGVSSLAVSGNLIAANSGMGIQLIGGTTSIQNNTVNNNANAGIGVSGASSGNGIYRNIVTGTAAGAGISIANAGSANNRISQNSTSLNNTLGIDLGSAGVTANDGATGGANNGMDYPIFALGTLAADGTTLHVKGFVGSAAGQNSFANATIELFKANNDANQNGEVIVGDGKSLAHGEGQTYLGTITADASGNFDVTLSVAGVAIGQPLTATASRCASNPCASATAAGNTSEFSANFSVTPVGINVTGTVYNNVNHNATKDPGETGTGLTLYAKLIQSGVVVQVVPVDTTIGNAASGTYTFTAVTIGTYSIIVDNNNLAGDVTPTLPAGWIGTEVPNQTLPLSVTQSTTPMPNQNFGLYNGSKISGSVFKDTGLGGGGIANDGVRNGSEAGISGATLSTTNASCVSSLCDTTTSDGNGNYTLYIPAAVGAGLVAINEVNASGYVSTGGTAGTSGGSYVRAGDATSFTNAVGASYTGVNFADVPDNGFLTDGSQNGLPGTVLFYAHTFTAGSAGSVAFSTANVPSPATPAWSNTLYQDSNCNGTLEAGEGASVLSAASVTPGQTLCVIAKVFIPAGAPMGAKDVITLTATMTYSNANPALVRSYTHTDTTSVSAVGASALTLTKSVDKAYALPNEVITYIITYANTSAVAIANVTISDAVPAYTLYVGNSAGCPNLVARSGCAVLTEPANNAGGALVWRITGNLAPGASGTVSYQVRVEQ